MNVLDQFLESLNKGSLPNHFTKGMGELIRKAREESGFNQRELANMIYRRQAALSEMENGLMQPDAGTLFILSSVLKKPINYFFPAPYKPDIQTEELTEIETELLIQARRLSKEDQKRIIAQVKAIGDMIK
jgi:transcriptional regulator with XRE-family HTH domain